MFHFFENLIAPTGGADLSAPPPGPAALLLALPGAGEMAVRGAVLRRLPRRHRRCLDSLVHRPARPLRDDDAARGLLGRARRVPCSPWRSSCVVGRPTGHRAAIADLQCRHHGQRHQPRALAEPSPCRAPELALLPERLRRPHRRAGDGDRRLAAPERHRHGHRRLGHPDLQRQRADPARHGQPLADAADPRLVRAATRCCCASSCRSSAIAPSAIRRLAR